MSLRFFFLFAGRTLSHEGKAIYISRCVCISTDVSSVWLYLHRPVQCQSVSSPACSVSACIVTGLSSVCIFPDLSSVCPYFFWSVCIFQILSASSPASLLLVSILSTRCPTTHHKLQSKLLERIFFGGGVLYIIIII